MRYVGIDCSIAAANETQITRVAAPGISSISRLDIADRLPYGSSHADANRFAAGDRRPTCSGQDHHRRRHRDRFPVSDGAPADRCVPYVDQLRDIDPIVGLHRALEKVGDTSLVVLDTTDMSVEDSVRWVADAWREGELELLAGPRS